MKKHVELELYTMMQKLRQEDETFISKCLCLGDYAPMPHTYVVCFTDKRLIFRSLNLRATIKGGFEIDFKSVDKVFVTRFLALVRNLVIVLKSGEELELHILPSSYLFSNPEYRTKPKELLDYLAEIGLMDV